MIYSVTQNASSEQIHIISALQYTCVIALVGMAVSLMVRLEPMKMVNKVNDVKSGKLQGLSKLLKTEISTAALSTATATGVMVAVMSLNTLIMYDHHHTAVDVSTVVTLHVIGMYAFSMPLGRLADRWGRI